MSSVLFKVIFLSLVLNVLCKGKKYKLAEPDIFVEPVLTIKLFVEIKYFFLNPDFRDLSVKLHNDYRYRHGVSNVQRDHRVGKLK